MRRTLYILIGVIALAFLGSAAVGVMLSGGHTSPPGAAAHSGTGSESDDDFQKVGASREDFAVNASDGTVLRGWKVHPQEPNGGWVLLFHGVSDNRAGMLGQAQVLLGHGYGVVMMDSRAHGESGGAMATYGWLERNDTRAVANALYATETPQVLLALGSSMGAAIALQSASVEPRIAGVVAESSFSDLREVSYDYAGFYRNVWLGKTLFRPATWTGLYAMERQGGFAADDVSPEGAVALRPFPVLLICDQLDHKIPCRHERRIFKAATGPKQLWEVPSASHAAALGAAPAEYEERVVGFFDQLRQGATSSAGSTGLR
jgi:pimeloyl-ACP methyl ester carboxylesterase